MLLTEPVKILASDSRIRTNVVMETVSSNSSATSASTAMITTIAPPTPYKSKNVSEKSDKFDSSSSNNLKGKIPPKPPEEFYKDLQQFHEKRGTPIMHMPKISGNNIDLHRLYTGITERGGFQKVNNRNDWEEIMSELGLPEKCVNGTAAIKYIYRRVLEKYERLNYFGEDPDKIDILDSNDINDVLTRGSRQRYPSSAYGVTNSSNIHNVSMTYNYRHHVVNMDRRRQYKLSTDLYKPSPYEKLMLSLLSPLPNEQDFAINACTLMANESKHTLKLGEYPKLLDALLAHAGVFSDYSMRKLFEHVYSRVRHHSLYAFWRDLLHAKPQILDFYTDEQAVRDSCLVPEDDKPVNKIYSRDGEYLELDFLNLGRGLGTQDYIGQRVLQIITILRNLSFFEENHLTLVKNRTLLRFLVMSSNIRWSNVHIQALEITGNIALELELCDPTIDDLSRNLMATLCEGIEGTDRAVIINCLEILYKLCQKDRNEDYILKCLNLHIYEILTQLMSLNDIMLLIFTLEAVYALTSLGRKSCQMLMQVRGIVHQLMSLITVEAQSYGPDGCILMRVIETIPGNMLPLVAQNIANLQNVAHIQNQAHINGPTMIQPKSHLINHTTIPSKQPINDSVDSSNNCDIGIVDSMESICSSTPSESLSYVSGSSIQNLNHDDEQFALTWLGATFERISSGDSHIEQQELYRMYLAHCQRSGKHSIVNHIQFPRLVRFLFTNTVGPMTLKRTDGTEIPGFHYVSIRLRSQTLPLQIKTTSPIISPPINSMKVNDSNPSSSRKTKRKSKTEIPTVELSGSNNCIIKKESSNSVVEKVNVLVTKSDTKSAAMFLKAELNDIVKTDMEKMEAVEVERVKKFLIKTEPVNITTSTTTAIEAQTQTSSADIVLVNNPTQTPSAIIKSLLANKVNQRQQKQKDISAAQMTANISHHSSPNTISSQVSVTTSVSQPIKVTSNAISALVNNPLMQNTPVKVGQTTIKPLNPQICLDKKSHLESIPPPLAPLSGGSVGNMGCVSNVIKDINGRSIMLANQVLVDIVDKKILDQTNTIPGTSVKRKLDEHDGNSNKRLALDTSLYTDELQVTPSKNAANLYAEMAASILEDEDIDDLPPPQNISHSSQMLMETQSTPLLIPNKVSNQTSTNHLANIPRQLLFQCNQPQLKITQPTVTTSPQLPNAVATIKTDQGLQTVPVILQQKPLDNNQSTAQIIQHVIHQATPHPQPTQYVLATNPQGQTYLVAQQPTPQPQHVQSQPSTQTVLVTQTPQQQSTGTKTIIILQQQTLSGGTVQPQIITNASTGAQKMLMTTSQGQQVFVTQRPQTPQQIFINPQTGAATHIQHVPVSAGGNANILSRQLIQTTQQIQQSQNLTAGQISPSLLNQLNQIPATIKLHQPVPTPPPTPQPTQPATISRLGKTVSIVQTGHIASASPVAIPQLQQHQSIIQQHIISGAPTEKRHVILGGGRAIEIKETVITQTHSQPSQQCHLNSQSITTAQPTAPPSPVITPPPHTLQTQTHHQQIRNIIEQQQHPSIIQQKISVPVIQTPLHTLSTTTTQSIKTTEHNSAIVHTKAIQQTSNITNTMASQTTSVINSTSVTINNNIKKTSINNPKLTTQTLSNKVIVPNPGQHHLSQISTGISTPVISGTQVIHKKEELIKVPTIANAKFITTTSVSISTATSSTTTTTTTTFAINNRNSTSIAAQSSPQLATSSISTMPSTVLNSTSTLQQKPSQQIIANANLQISNFPPTIHQIPVAEAQWLFICDWRNCPRFKFKSVNDLQHHVCTVHVPDHLDSSAEIFCQWGVGPGLCDGIPRKRFALMTHLIERHLTLDNLRAAVQRRLTTGIHNIAPSKPPVTIVRNMEPSLRNNNNSTASTASSSPTSMQQGSVTGPSALQAIKRHTVDFLNSHELMDENEGPVTKSIRLTAALILRNLVTYTSTAKNCLRRYESNLANIALSNVESSGTVSNILYELNN